MSSFEVLDLRHRPVGPAPQPGQTPRHLCRAPGTAAAEGFFGMRSPGRRTLSEQFQAMPLAAVAPVAALSFSGLHSHSPSQEQAKSSPLGRRSGCGGRCLKSLSGSSQSFMIPTEVGNAPKPHAESSDPEIISKDSQSTQTRLRRRPEQTPGGLSGLLGSQVTAGSW